MKYRFVKKQVFDFSDLLRDNVILDNFVFSIFFLRYFILKMFIILHRTYAKGCDLHIIAFVSNITKTHLLLICWN